MRRGLLSITYRRKLLDADLERACTGLSGIVLDLGGEHRGRRGRFRPPQRPGLRWLCLNLDAETAPDVLADVESIPFANECADAVVCTEVLEHTPRPEQVIAECARLLKPGARLILSMPFLVPVHADPYDYQRFTAEKLASLLKEAGLVVETVQKQGLYFTVLADMLQTLIREIRPTPVRWLIAGLALPILRALIWLEGRPKLARSRLICNYTTGYLVIAHKPNGCQSLDNLTERPTAPRMKKGVWYS